MAANFEGRTDVKFPHIVSELSTGRILVTHFESGVKITDKAGGQLKKRSKKITLR